MTLNARKCVTAVSPSGWVRTWIQMCDGSLAVLFSDGACCWYPKAPPAYFNLALAWHDAGEFVHRFLYRILPYKRIRLPCPPAGCGGSNPCCPGGTPTTLTATVFGNLGQEGTVTLTYDSSTNQWEGSASTSSWTNCAVGPPAGLTLSLRLACVLSGGNWSWQVSMSCDGFATTAICSSTTLLSCSPFYLTTSCAGQFASCTDCGVNTSVAITE